jgi:hypothetical protein
MGFPWMVHWWVLLGHIILSELLLLGFTPCEEGDNKGIKAVCSIAKGCLFVWLSKNQTNKLGGVSVPDTYFAWNSRYTTHLGLNIFWTQLQLALFLPLLQWLIAKLFLHPGMYVVTKITYLGEENKYVFFVTTYKKNTYLGEETSMYFCYYIQEEYILVSWPAWALKSGPRNWNWPSTQHMGCSQTFDAF